MVTNTQISAHAVIKKTKRRFGSQRGAALVIAIFSLMLISVVATSLILTAGTQSAIKSNYKSAMQAFYDAKAGLEEARGRLWANANPNPNIPDPVTSCVFPAGSGGNMPIGQICYIINPSGGEIVDPTNLNLSNPYADFEYQQEWNTAPTGAQLIPSTSATAGIAGPLYKWVRITPRTNQSAGFPGDNSPLFFTGQNSDSNPTAAQVLTITSLAVTPYGSRRMVQYTVAASAFTAALTTFPSALTLDGNGVSYAGPQANGGGQGQGQGNNSNFHIDGNDLNGLPGVPAIGYTNSNDGSNVSKAALPSTNYLSPAGVPNVGFLPASTPQMPGGLPSILQTPSGLDSLVQSITRGADLVVTPSSGTADQTSLPPAMSVSAQNPNPTPMVVVVNGNFNLHGNGTSYGLLLVTGTLDYDPDASWNGVILVIGKGIFTSNKNGQGGITGAVLVAQTRTRDAAFTLLPDPNLGAASFSQTGGGKGIHYSSNSVAAAQGLIPYQVLSFREIAQTTP